MNRLYNMMGGGMPPVVQQFLEFKKGFTGDAQTQVQQLLSTGKISQAQYDQAVKMAQQLQAMLTPSVRR